MSKRYMVGHIAFEARPNGQVFGGFDYCCQTNLTRHDRRLQAAVAQVNREQGLRLTCNWH